MPQQNVQPCRTHGVIHRYGTKAYDQCPDNNQNSSQKPHKQDFNGMLSWIRSDSPKQNTLGEVKKNDTSHEKRTIDPNIRSENSPETLRIGEDFFVRADKSGDELDYILYDGSGIVSIRLQFDEDIHDDDIDDVLGITSYCMKATAGGENLPVIDRDGETHVGYMDSSNSIVVAYDMTKSPRSYPIENLEIDFTEEIGRMVSEGTPIRKTDRNGKKGTRLIDGKGDGFAFPVIYFGGSYTDEEMGR